MAALTADFDSYIKNLRAVQAYIVGTSNVIFRGGLVQVDGSGLAQAAASGNAYKVVGRAATSTAATDPAGTTVIVEEGDVFQNLAPSAQNPPAQANIGQKVYVLSDNEVTTASATGAVAGILVAIQDSGCLLRTTLEANQ